MTCRLQNGKNICGCAVPTTKQCLQKGQNLLSSKEFSVKTEKKSPITCLTNLFSNTRLQLQRFQRQFPFEMERVGNWLDMVLIHRDRGRSMYCIQGVARIDTSISFMLLHSTKQDDSLRKQTRKQRPVSIQRNRACATQQCHEDCSESDATAAKLRHVDPSIQSLQLEGGVALALLQCYKQRHHELAASAGIELRAHQVCLLGEIQS